mmetsp:Transcript_3200/g.4058  ORF Transcript_3200/g.4058 Transcript_3200/m.4058 type:complete len:121 (+) Transcript_3200:288-650(+)
MNISRTHNQTPRWVYENDQLKKRIWVPKDTDIIQIKSYRSCNRGATSSVNINIDAVDVNVGVAEFLDRFRDDDNFVSHLSEQMMYSKKLDLKGVVNFFENIISHGIVSLMPPASTYRTTS